MPTALVTGASVGLGAAFAAALARRGHDLVLVARDEAGLRVVAGQLSARYGIAVEVLAADLVDSDGCARVAGRLAEPLRPIDVLVNNAGIGTYRPFAQAPLADELAMLDLNVRAVLTLTHAALPPMLARDAGRIVNVSSVAGFVPRPGNVTYGASKSWVTAFSEALALQLAGSAVSVTAVCPGLTRTQFHQRAGADMSASPGWLWLRAETVAEQGLADAWRGRTISIPSRRYQLLVGASRLLPRPLLRRLA